MIRAMILVATLAMGASCVDGNSEPESAVTQQDCVRLREHLIDVQLNGAGGDPALASQHREAHRQVLGEAFLQSCMAKVDRDALACGLAAGNAAAIQTCALP
jgi:hypothetical protein